MLGYTRSDDDAPVHPVLGFVCVQPGALVGVDVEALAALHEPDRWLNEDAPPPPDLPADLAEAVAAAGLSWHGAAGAWLAPSGHWLSAARAIDLGPDSIRQQGTAYEDWRRAARRGARVGCLLWGGMVVWLMVGWALGLGPWLVGMAAIIAAAWWTRSPRPPSALLDPPDPALLDQWLGAAREHLGEPWTPLAEETAILCLGPARIYLPRLRRALRDPVDPDALRALLEALAPAEPS
ncbi:MAG: hypothetical protein H6739_26835 [Alphaproteobacteria bacterium]|nr:hypothetical protein [Alphaproteobacteria bacterium]